MTKGHEGKGQEEERTARWDEMRRESERAQLAKEIMTLACKVLNVLAPASSDELRRGALERAWWMVTSSPAPDAVVSIRDGRLLRRGGETSKAPLVEASTEKVTSV